MLLAVHPNYRGKGTGSALLEMCENEIGGKGYEKSELGGFLYGALTKTPSHHCIRFSMRLSAWVYPSL